MAHFSSDAGGESEVVMRAWRQRRPVAVAVIVSLLLATAVAVTPVLVTPAAPVAAAAGAQSPPIWLPFRAPMKVGCVKSNCAGPYHGYWAIDFETITNQPGQPVYAAGAGQVHVISRGTGCGPSGTAANALSIDHGGGVQSIYFHLHDFAVADGAWVTPNTVIGHVGSTGYTVPCPDYHLHYEKRIDGASVDPGQLQACQGWKLVSYPNAISYSSWNSIPPQDTAGGALDPAGRVVYSDGNNCAANSYGSSIAVAAGAGGRLEMVGVNFADQVQQAHQSAAGATSWTALTSAPGVLHSVAAETNRDGRVELFGVSAAGALWHRSQVTPGGDWSAWAQLSGSVRNVAAARRSDGRLEIVATNASGAIYQRHQLSAGSSTWSPWYLVPGQARTVAAQSNRDGRVELFAVAGDGSLYHRWQVAPTGAWTSWAPLNGTVRSVAVTQRRNGQLEIVAANSAGQVYQRHQLAPGSGSWSPWYLVPGTLRDVAAETNADGRVELFGVNATGAIYHRWQAPGTLAWTSWVRLAGNLRP
jgi:hypothetical protein